MDPAQAFLLSGSKKVVESTFSSIFDKLSRKTTAWYELKKMTSAGTEKYADYICRRVGEFPLFATTKSASVERTYVKLHISPTIGRELYRSPLTIKRELLRQKLGQATAGQELTSPLEALESSRNGFALLGAPGSGKTTAFRHIAVLAAKGLLIRAQTRLPIYLAVRDLRPESIGLLNAAADFLRFLDIKEPMLVLTALLSSGSCILLLDGLDETTPDQQKVFLSELAELQLKYPESIFCVSARPFSLSKGLPGFQKWETQPLSFDDRIAFVDNWFSSIGSEQGSQLIDKCRATPGLLDLGSNPLLLSIICALYHNDLNIPSEPDELYGRAIEGILGGWDAFRNISRHTDLAHLSLHKRIITASTIAATLFAHGKIVFSKSELEESGCLPALAQRMSVEMPDASRLLDCLYNDFGLILERAPGLYAFSHLTIQEYLAARYIVENRREINLLSTHYRDPVWREVVLLVAKMLPSAEEYVKYVFGRTKVNDPTSIALLQSVLAMRPHCPSEVRDALMGRFCQHVVRCTKRIAGSYRLEEGNIIIFVSRELMPVRFAANIAEAREQIRLDRNGETSQDAHDEERERSVEEEALNRRNARRESKRKLKKNARGPNDYMVMFGCLDEMWRVIHLSTFDFQQKGLAGNSLLALFAQPPPEYHVDVIVESV